MRRIELSLAVLLIFCATQSRIAAQEVDEKYAEQLRKHGIIVHPLDTEDVRAYITKKADPAKAPELLNRLKNITVLCLLLDDGLLTDGHLKMIKAFPKLKAVEIRSHQLSEQDIARIVTVGQLEEITLESREFSEAHLRLLQKLKGVKRLHLDCVDVSPKALAEFEKALGESLSVFRFPSLSFFPALTILDAEDVAMKLKKEKVNAALAGIQSYMTLVKAGSASYFNLELVEMARNLKAAALDLDDPSLRLKLVDGYVQLLALAAEEAEHAFKAGGGSFKPYQYHTLRYHHFDARLLQLQLTKQSKKE